jgi:hypothetical protein
MIVLKDLQDHSFEKIILSCEGIIKDLFSVDYFL